MTSNLFKTILKNNYQIFKDSQNKNVDKRITLYNTRLFKVLKYNIFKKFIDDRKFSFNK